MKITIITHNIPNSHSEQASNDPILFFNYLEKKNIKFNLISIWEPIFNTSNKSKNFQVKYLKKKYKNLNKLNVIDFSLKPFERFKRFFLRILSNKVHYFYGNKKLSDEVLSLINRDEKQIILNFFELPASIFLEKNKKIKVFNYFGIHRKISERLRIINLKKNLNLISFLKIINALVYFIKIDYLYKKILNGAHLNFYAARDTYEIMKKFKNTRWTGPLSNNYNYPGKKKSKVPVVLMIGALKSNLMQDSLSMVAEKAEELNKIYQKKKFILRIVGKYKPHKNLQKKLNYPWVVFTGWVKDAKKEYKNATYLFVPNSLKIGTRTKMLEATATKTCVLTTKQNIVINFPSFKNKNDMIIARDMDEFCREFKNLLYDEKFKNKLIQNALKKYKIKYDPEIIIQKVFKLIQRA